MKHTLPKLNYGYDALEPFIDAKTMEIHYTKHHQAYVDKLNLALTNHKDLQKLSAEELISNLNVLPEEIRTPIKNNGGGHLNHSFFWPLLKKNVEFNGEIKKTIEKKFNNFEEFKKKFTEASMNRFGSGWVWLVKKGKEIEIVSTLNQDSPLSEGMKPLLCIDLWEHAYYLKYQNRRNEYIEAFFNIINWGQVNKNFTGGR